MHDLKFPDELLWKIHPSHLHPVIQAGEGTIFSDATASFRDMMERVRLLTHLPEFMVRATAEQIMFDVASCYEALGNPLATGPFDEVQRAKLLGVRERMLAVKVEASKDANYVQMSLQKSITDSTNMLRTLCSDSEAHDNTLTGMEALLIAMMIQTWTAFEAFATDVWVVALNLGPKSFARQVAKVKTDSERGKDEGKTIKISSLERFNFDLTKSMGSLLKEKFDFARLASIKTAYLTAFGESLAPVFDTDNLNPANVGVLEALRNVFAHRGGRADGKFRGLVSKCPASEYYELRNLEDDRKVEIDSAMVRDLWLSTCATATGLLVLVKGKIENAT